MSKSVKRVVSVALPIIGTLVAPGIGTALGSTLSGAALGTIGGAIGGAAGGLVSGGGLKGAAIGGITGGLGAAAGGLTSGAAAGAAGGTSIANPSIPGTSFILDSGSGASSAGSGVANLASGVTRSLSAPVIGNISRGQLLNAASGIVGGMNQDAAEEAAKLQREGIETGIKANQSALKPYTELGQQATQRIQEIQSDPAAYIKGNELYGSLASDAERRLLANQAAKGKVGSGGTAAALQEQLLNIGTGLVNNEIGNLQNQAGLGGQAASQVGSTNYNGNTAVGNANAAGTIGSNNALTSTYQDQINTILAQQGLNKAPIYSSPLNL